MISIQMALRIAGSALHDLRMYWFCFSIRVPAYQSQYSIAPKIGGHQSPPSQPNFSLLHPQLSVGVYNCRGTTLEVSAFYEQSFDLKVGRGCDAMKRQILMEAELAYGTSSNGGASLG